MSGAVPDEGPVASSTVRAKAEALALLAHGGGGRWGWVVANITVRNLDDEVQRRLKQRAATHGRSMEAEARAILTSALARGGLARAWLEATSELRGPDLTLPPRTAPRQVDLG